MVAAPAVFHGLISRGHAISNVLQSLDKMVSLMTPSIQKLHRLLDRMRAQPKGVTYSELLQVCEHYFGQARQSGTSHAVFATPWPGDPRANIQNDHGSAKAYQVRQVLKAIEKITEERSDGQ